MIHIALGTTIDGKDVDLSGGYYDAGDTIKFGFPLAFTMTTLAWGGITYFDAYVSIGEDERLLESIKWGVDWLVKAIILDDQENISEIFVQVGDPAKEHKLWNRPEDFVEGKSRL